jgi:hypothetical protein
MSDSKAQTSNSLPTLADPERRQLFKTAGAAVLATAISGLSISTPSSHAQKSNDFPKPGKLLPGAQLDSRFPVSFATRSVRVCD